MFFLISRAEAVVLIDSFHDGAFLVTNCDQGSDYPLHNLKGSNKGNSKPQGKGSTKSTQELIEVVLLDLLDVFYVAVWVIYVNLQIKKKNNY